MGALSGETLRQFVPKPDMNQRPRRWRRFSNPGGSVHVVELAIDGALFHIHEQMPESAELSRETLKGTSSKPVP
jgi:hypothetical protein